MVKLLHDISSTAARWPWRAGTFLANRARSIFKGISTIFLDIEHSYGYLAHCILEKSFCEGVGTADGDS